MFDPLHIGRLHSNYIKVTHVVATKKKYSPFKALVTLQGHTHALLLKPNLEWYRDQIVADRIKHMAGLRPMHTFGLELNFAYCDGKRVETEWMDYFAFALSKNEVESPDSLPTLQTVDRSLFESFRFRVELCKIILFRYMLGFSNTCEEHILIRDGMPISISETKIGSSLLSREFLDQFSFIEAKAWEEGKKELLEHFNLDNLRGCLLQTRMAERNIFHRTSKGPLSIQVKKMAELIEERFSILEDFLFVTNSNSITNRNSTTELLSLISK